MALVRRVVVTPVAMAMPGVRLMMRPIPVTMMAVTMMAVTMMLMTMVRQCAEGNESRQRRDDIRIVVRFCRYTREGQRQ